MPEKPAKTTAFLHTIELGVGAMSWGDRIIWNYGHGHTDADIEEAFNGSIAHGVHFLDTAEVYGMGRSERFVGKLAKSSQQPILVATKFLPFPWRLRKQNLLDALQHSLERLELERVDLYQIHWPFPPLPVETWAEALAEAVKAGLTRTVGVSNYDKNQMQRAYTVLSKYNIPLASNQVEYNLLDRTVEKNGLLARCHEMNIRLIAYSPLAKGMLSGKYGPENPPPGMRNRMYTWALKRIPSLISLMSEIGKEHGGKTPSQVALNWIICKGALPIPGAKNGAQAKENAGALGWRLKTEEVKALDKASDDLSR